MLALPARATIVPPTTTTAPTGISPRASARCASRRAARIHAATSPPLDALRRRPPPAAAARTFCSALLAAVLGAALVTAALVAALVAAVAGLLLALLHVVFADRHGLGDALHRPAGQREVLQHELTVDLRPPGRGGGHHQRSRDHPDSWLHTLASLRSRRVVYASTHGATHPLSKCPHPRESYGAR